MSRKCRDRSIISKENSLSKGFKVGVSEVLGLWKASVPGTARSGVRAV